MASKEALALLEAAFPGSGPGPGLLCAQSRCRRCFLAGPPDPRCRLACPVSAVNLAAQPEEERGGAGPAGRQPGVESRGWGHWRWLGEADREGRGLWGRLGGTSPGWGAAVTPVAGATAFRASV